MHPKILELACLFNISSTFSISNLISQSKLRSHSRMDGRAVETLLIASGRVSQSPRASQQRSRAPEALARQKKPHKALQGLLNGLKVFIRPCKGFIKALGPCSQRLYFSSKKAESYHMDGNELYPLQHVPNQLGHLKTTKNS